MADLPAVLFVDDDATILAALAATFRHAPVTLHFARSAAEALRTFEEIRPDVVVSDHRMPGTTGVELLETIQHRAPDTFRVLLTGYADVETALDAVNRSQVHRIVTKPWEVTGLRELVVGAAETAALERFARDSLLANGLMQTVSALAAAIEAKDPYTRGHSELVGRYAEALAGRLGMSEDEVRAARLGGLLHDCGKIGVPERILLKPGRLDDDEFREMKRHPEVGFGIVAPIADLPEIARDAVLHHHERWDGRGYPHGVAGEEISPVARVIHVADAYEAMTAPRAYRGPQKPDYILGELTRERGRQFDPVAADAALALVEAGTFDTLRGTVTVQPQLGCREMREADPDLLDDAAAS